MGSYEGHFLTTLTLIALFSLPLHSSSLPSSNTSSETTQRSDLEILGSGIRIGNGGGVSLQESGPGSPPFSPPPFAPPPSPPVLPQFENKKLQQAYDVIQKFKITITLDPKRITDTWIGYNPCQYRGFFCSFAPDDSKDRTIASIDFNGLQLSAPTVSGFVDRLPDLALFHVNSNNFSGTIPDLTRLRYLYEFDVSNNHFMGSFPSNALPLANLTFLDLRFNRFTGAVPPSVYSLGLEVLFLNNNNFNQVIPADLGNFTVSYLTLANNNFKGSIPSSIGKASNALLEVLFLNNSFSGCLPSEIGFLKNVTVFDVSFNQITGPIPLSFGCLENVEQLNLAGNLLYGKVPDAVCRLGKLANLSLSSNYFTSIGLSCWRLLKTGVLDVRNNCILGFPDQRSPWECLRFLSHLQHCPLLTYIPCWLPKKESGGNAVPSRPSLPAPETKPAGEGGRAYTSYSALFNRHAP